MLDILFPLKLYVDFMNRNINENNTIIMPEMINVLINRFRATVMHLSRPEAMNSRIPYQCILLASNNAQPTPYLFFWIVKQ